MAELRWLLLIFGVAVIAAIYFYSRYQTQIEAKLRDLQEASRKKRVAEPSVTERVEPEVVSFEEEQAQPEEPPAPEIPAVPGKVVAIRLMSRETAGFPAEQLLLAMRELGLRHGQFGIFHRPSDADPAQALYSVASLVEPGSFDLTELKTRFYPGVSIFMALPGVIDGVEAFDQMLDTARELARKLEGELLDEQGSSLSIQRERYIREEIIQFEHQPLA